MVLKIRNIKIILFLLAFLMVFDTNASIVLLKDSAQSGKVNYLPVINGTIRGKYEYQYTEGLSRFQMRNARVSLKGNVSNIIDYKAEIDLCDREKIKMLDAYGRIHWKNIGYLTMGQMRVPFGTAVFRGPHLLMLSNRSFISKQIANVRDVGVRLSYAPTNLPLKIEAGAFNGSGLTRQNEWHSEFAFAARANLNLNGVNFAVSGMSLYPQDIRINLFDTSLSWTYDRVFLEGEYIYKHYTNNAFDDVHAYHIVGQYKLPIKKYLKHLAFTGRFDAMTDNSSGYKNSEGLLQVDDCEKKRITAGITLTPALNIRTEVRVNYEKYFYDDISFANESEMDKLVLELMIRF